MYSAVETYGALSGSLPRPPLPSEKRQGGRKGGLVGFVTEVWEDEVCSECSELRSESGEPGFGRIAAGDALPAFVDTEGAAGVHHPGSPGRSAS